MPQPLTRIQLGLMVLGMAAVSATVQAASPSGAGQAAIPLPRGIGGLPAPTRVDLGTSTLYVQAFAVNMDDEALVAFYEQALPNAGWRIEQLPWQANQDKAANGLKRALTYHRKDLDDEQRQQAEAWLARLEDGRQALRRQIYATNGSEHVIVNLWPLNHSTGTTVFINRWSGDRRWLGWGQHPVGSGLRTQDAGRRMQETGSRTQDAGDRILNPESWILHPNEAQNGFQGGFPMANVCCSGEEVPDLTGALPFSIPRYPEAKAVARTTPPGGVSTTVLLMVPDGASAVAAYYRSEMPASGWKLLEEQGPAEGSGTAVRHLRFQRPDRVCDLTIAAAAKDTTDATGPQTLVTVAVRPRVHGGRQ